MFLRRQGVYIIAFNMSTLAENEFSNIYAGTERLQFWIESVYSHVPPEAPIFLVGTHRGTMEKNCIKTLDEHLRRSFWNSYCDQLIVNEHEELIFFPVENSNGNRDIGIKALQMKIMSVAEQRKGTIGRDIPMSWIRMQGAIVSLQDKKEAKFCVTLKELPLSLDNFVCSNWSTETLRFFHEKGLIVFLEEKQNPDLSKWVLLKPEILVDVIIQLVTPPPEVTSGMTGIVCR